MNKTGNYFEKSSYLARKLHGKNQPENTKIVGKQPYKIGMKCDLDWDTWIDFIKYKERTLNPLFFKLL